MLIHTERNAAMRSPFFGKLFFGALAFTFFSHISSAIAQPGSATLPPTHKGKPTEKPTMTAADLKAAYDKMMLKLQAELDARESSTATATRGVMSAPGENNGGDKDAPYVARPRNPAFDGVRITRANMASYKSRAVSQDPKAQDYLKAIKSALLGFEFKTALLAEHKYMLADCVGIKVSAGDFSMKVPDPDARIDNNGIVVTFTIPHIAMSGVQLRFRPDVADTMQPCRFSSKVGVGATADNVSLELHFDPLLDADRCKVGSIGNVTTTWTIGHLRVSPLPSDVVDLAANIVEDALTLGSNFSIVDRIVAGINGVAGARCHA